MLGTADPNSSATNSSTAHERFTTPKLTDSMKIETFNCIENGDKLKVCMK